MPDRKLLVAVFGAPHGVRGEVRLKSYTADPQAVLDYSPLISEDGRQRFEITSVRPQGDMLVARVKGIADRDAAARLTNLKLYVPREQLPATQDEDDFYLADLIGLTVETQEGEVMGTVAAVPNYGAGDLLEIAPQGGGKSALLPFLKAFVPVVDIAAGRIVVSPPEGLFGDAEPEPGEDGAEGVRP